jgi:predicted house-cleaning NTP pyrophosphatase (Maf/HAM1 superfamily)
MRDARSLDLRMSAINCLRNENRLICDLVSVAHMDMVATLVQEKYKPMTNLIWAAVLVPDRSVCCSGSLIEKPINASSSKRLCIPLR